MGKDSGSNNPHILQDAGRLKLGINATFLNEKPTGLGVFTREVAQGICRLNKETVIFSPVTVGEISEGQIIRMPLSIRGSLKFRNNLYRAVYLNTILPLRCKTEKMDILFCPMMEFPFISSVPLVVNIHDLHPLRFPLQFGKAAAYFRFSLKLLKKAVRRVTVVSEFVKRELMAAINIPEEKVDVIPNGYSRKLFYPQSPEAIGAFIEKYSLPENYILLVGNLFPYKNVKTLLNAFLRIKDRIRHSLVIVGSREFLHEPLPIDERIFYMDYVPYEDLPKFYSYADAFVHPSLSEGFGLTPLEAMACGVPVISSNAGSLPEVVGKAGMLFDPLDTEHLSRLIEEVVKNEGLRRELIKKGLENAKRFSWEKTAEGILKSCERALKEK